jgi:creatinine amidohydrolase/Fe(II)-dependent formamide hydrolase-like protein
MFTGLLRIGFRNIHVVIHHQTENFTVGMPTDLAFKFAARQAIFAFLEGHRGEGWWGAESMADYYARQSTGDDPFNWIKAHPLMPPSVMDGYPFDHAGQGETSLLMALVPEGVDQSRISTDKWYSRSARDASAELGIKGRDCILEHLRKELGANRANAHSARN